MKIIKVMFVEVNLQNIDKPLNWHRPSETPFSSAYIFTNWYYLY